MKAIILFLFPIFLIGQQDPLQHIYDSHWSLESLVKNQHPTNVPNGDSLAVVTEWKHKRIKGKGAAIFSRDADGKLIWNISRAYIKKQPGAFYWSLMGDYRKLEEQFERIHKADKYAITNHEWKYPYKIRVQYSNEFRPLSNGDSVRVFTELKRFAQSNNLAFTYFHKDRILRYAYTLYARNSDEQHMILSKLESLGLQQCAGNTFKGCFFSLWCRL